MREADTVGAEMEVVEATGSAETAEEAMAVDTTAVKATTAEAAMVRLPHRICRWSRPFC